MIPSPLAATLSLAQGIPSTVPMSVSLVVNIIDVVRNRIDRIISQVHPVMTGLSLALRHRDE
jgi:hypothetical protein